MAATTPGKPWEHSKSGEGSAEDPVAAAFVESLSYDTRLYRHDIAGSIAHARMLSEAKLITAEELAAIEGGLEAIREEIEQQGASWAGWRLELEDVHMCIEAALTAKIGDAGRKLHTGRSRNDQVALDLKLWLEEAAETLDTRFGALYEAFVSLAERDGRIVMPAYTHLQRAQPIVVGGELMAWLAALERCQSRVAALQGVNRQNPLGSGAIAGSSLPLARAHVAAALPVGPPTASAIDATANRDAALDFVYSLSMIAMTLSRWAEQWIIYCTTEFGFLKLDGRYTTGSSMMPQKQNPDMLELIRGRCGGVYGHLMALLTMCKGITIGYNRDLQEDKRSLFAAYDSVVACMDMAARIVATARFDAKRIEATLAAGFLDATSLAEYLVDKGVPFRTAHGVVGRAVGRCREQGIVRLSELSVADFAEVAGEFHIDGATFGPDVYDWLDPQRVVERYRTQGNAGISGFEEQLARWRQRMASSVTA